ncbi:MAG: DUF5320 domain-containing protein [Bacteroidales bacterium]|nr:DUF5320 domain-containing protein [Bacteroidales bacterium]
MPGFDQTGPEGKGPQTGGQRGRCGNEQGPRNRRNAFRRGWFGDSEQSTDPNQFPFREGGRCFGQRFGGRGRGQRFRGGQD